VIKKLTVEIVFMRNLFFSFIKMSVIASILLGSSSSVYADIVDMDWKIEGDGRAFLDEATGTEWIKLNETLGYSLDDMTNTLNTTNEYDGFRIATEGEVNALMFEMLTGMPNLTINTNFDYPKYDSSVYADRALMQSYISVLGQTKQQSTNKAIIGLYYNNDGGGLISNAISYLTSSSIYASMYYDRDFLTSNSAGTAGIFLVSDGGATWSSSNYPELMANNTAASNVNAPLLSIAGLVLMGLSGLRKRK
jgi:hypothetical protein